MSSVTVKPLSRTGYTADIVCPPDKSISIRAVILSAYAVGKSVIKNISMCGDVMTAADCMRRLGAELEFRGGDLHVIGAPFVSAELDCGNSATAARLLTGLLSGLNGVFRLNGDGSLSKRPMKRITDPLTVMGARIESSGGCLPLKIIGSALNGIEYFMPVSSAQVKSSLLLAGLNAANTVTVTEKFKTRDHTEKMLRAMGANISIVENTVKLAPGILYGNDITVPGDISAAAYHICLALATKSKCTVRGTGINETRIGFLNVLRRIGAHISVSNERSAEEPIADLTVVGDRKLKPINIGECEVPAVIDEIPALCALACFIDGTSVIDGASELRCKESDRITTVVNALKSLGADIYETADGIVINGGGELSFGKVDPCGDHRIAMAAAVAAAAGGGAEIIGAECVSVSYPAFFKEVIGV